MDSFKAINPQMGSYLVSFVSQRTALGDSEYQATAEKMVTIALEEYGCLGVHSTRNQDGFGITNSYWKDLEDIKQWRDDPRHLKAQAKGHELWYQAFELTIAKIERSYDFKK